MESNETVTVTVVALKQFSTGTISMFKGEICEMDSTTAETLIDNGLVEEYVPDVPPVGANDKDKFLHTNAETGEKEWSTVSNGVLVVTDTDGTLDKTWQEIHDGGFGIVVGDLGSGISYLPIQSVDSAPFLNAYNVYVLSYGDDGAYLVQYKASSASGYPSVDDNVEELGPISEG